MACENGVLRRQETSKARGRSLSTHRTRLGLTGNRLGFEAIASRYTYILMGLNHTLKHRAIDGNKEEERAQTLALAMTLMHRYRKVAERNRWEVDNDALR